MTCIHHNVREPTTATPLQPNTDMPVNEPHRIPMKWSFLGSLLLLLPMVLIVAFVIVTNVTGRSTVSDNSVVGYLRGGRMMVIRLPSTTLSHGIISVFNDGRVGLPNDNTTFQILASTWKEVQDLHTHWCRSKPSFRALGTNEPYYIVGLNCAMFNQSQIKVPTDQLPPVLTEVIHSAS